MLFLVSIFLIIGCIFFSIFIYIFIPIIYFIPVVIDSLGIIDFLNNILNKKASWIMTVRRDAYYICNYCCSTFLINEDIEKTTCCGCHKQIRLEAPKYKGKEEVEFNKDLLDISRFTVFNELIRSDGVHDPREKAFVKNYFKKSNFGLKLLVSWELISCSLQSTTEKRASFEVLKLVYRQEQKKLITDTRSYLKLLVSDEFLHDREKTRIMEILVRDLEYSENEVKKIFSDIKFSF